MFQIKTQKQYLISKTNKKKRFPLFLFDLTSFNILI